MLLIAGVAAASLLPRDAASARTVRHARCPPTGANLISGNGTVRVYSTGGTTFANGRLTFTPTRTEACLVRWGTRMTLVAPARGLRKSLRGLALSGTVVAYLEGQFGIDAGCVGITVVDVASRRVLRSLPEVGCSVDACFRRCEVVTDLVVGPRGSVAWILDREEGAPMHIAPRTLLVYAAPTSGPAIVLDEGPDIGDTSLNLSAGSLSWWHAGVERTATLR